MTQSLYQYKMKLHNPSDPVNYNKNKHSWIQMDTKHTSSPKCFRLTKVPYMTTGKHVPRYNQQKELVDIYLKSSDHNLVDNVFEYMKKYGEIPNCKNK